MHQYLTAQRTAVGARIHLGLCLLLAFTSSAAAASNADCTVRAARVAVDIGHTPRRFGATSARGGREFDFNQRFAKELIEEARRETRLEAFLISPDNFAVGLRKRSQLADASGANAFISIHHDSAQRNLLTTWEHGGRTFLRTDEISGFSLFVSRENPNFVVSTEIARAIARQWLAAGHNRTLHHAAPVKGENRKLIDRDLGVYEAPFSVVKRTHIPAVLIEVGVLVNPTEENWLNQRENRQKLQLGLIKALTASLCGDIHPPKPELAKPDQNSDKK